MKTRSVLILVLLLVGLGSLAVRHYVGRLERGGEPPRLTAAEEAEVDAWIRQNAVALKTVEAGNGFDDMQPLRGLIGDARLVLLGEDAHCNRSFAQAKHRMLEFLVSEMGFTVFVIEGPFDGALELNDYLLTGDGDPVRALGSLVYLAWTNEAMLDMVRWMRAYNETHETKVKFYGADMQSARGSAGVVLEYLRQRDIGQAYQPLLETMTDPMANRPEFGASEAEAEAMEKTRELIRMLEDRPPEDERQRERWAVAIQNARVILQCQDFWNQPSISQATKLRDRCMAENVRWIMEHEGAKVVVGAANPHINAAPRCGSMGMYLRQAYGDEMVAIAFLTNRQFADESELRQAEGEGPGLFAAERGTLEAELVRAGLARAVLDFRSLPGGTVSRYLKSPLKTGGIQMVYPSAFDAVLFIESTLMARGAGGVSVQRAQTLPAPANPGFEKLDGQDARDWRSQGGQAWFEYETIGSDDQPYEGDRCGMIRRRPGRPFGQPVGRLYQTVRAEAFRGKTLVFRAAACSEGPTARLWLSIDVRQAPSIYLEQAVTSDRWQEYHIETSVPPNALKISYGLAYAGGGAAWIDAVAVEADGEVQ